MSQRNTKARPRRLMLESLESRELLAVAIEFDDQFDPGFYSGERKVALDAAAQSVGGRLNNRLAEIRATGNNSWTARFDNPATGDLVGQRNMVIPQNTIRIFVGDRPLKTSPRLTVAYADNEWYAESAYHSGTRQWHDLVRRRGQQGISTWGGSIAFNSQLSWHLGGLGTQVLQHQYDLYSVAVHEIMHILGFDGKNFASRDLIHGGKFTGQHASAANNGKPVFMHNRNDHNHWAPATRSNGRPAAMIPSGSPGFQRPLTELDFAALADIGWRVESTSLGSQARFDDDLKADRAVWRPSTGTWYVTNSSTGATIARQWGLSGDVPVNADFDGDGRSDFAVWRPGNGVWYVINSSNGSTWSRQWGLQGDVPVPGDYDGDGRTDLAVWRPSNGVWYVINSSTDTTVARQWGLPGDVPVPGDYDGDSRTDMAIWRPSTGRWHVINSNGGPWSLTWGVPGDIPVPGDYDGDGRTDLTIWRPRDGTWWTIRSSTGVGIRRQWGLSIDIPQPADFDGDGKTDMAVWRPYLGNWHIIQSSNDQTVTHQWGLFGDRPIASASAFSATSLVASGRPLRNAKGPLPHARQVQASSGWSLDQGRFTSLVDEAIRIWRDADLDNARIGRLDDITVHLRDLPQSQLGLADRTDVYIDDDAAGHGWFIDETPGRNEEFATDSTGGLIAQSGYAASERIDLLTVLVHEFGHVLGYVDLDAAQHTGHVMAEELAPGLRRVSPSALELALSADVVFGEHGRLDIPDEDASDEPYVAVRAHKGNAESDAMHRHSPAPRPRVPAWAPREAPPAANRSARVVQWRLMDSEFDLADPIRELVDELTRLMSV